MRGYDNRWMLPCKETTGSALVTALVLVSAALVLTGIALAAYLMRYKYIQQDVHHTQAQYIAEAGLFSVVDGLQRQPAWRPSDSLLALPDETQSRVDVTPYGGYLWVRSTATAGRSRYTSRALVGQAPTTWFNQALVLWDRSDSGIHLNGRTYITGDLSIVAPQGREIDTLDAQIDGEGFSGQVAGHVARFDSLNLGWRADVFLETLAWCDRLLADPHVVPPRRQVPGESQPLPLPLEQPRIRFEGAAHLTEDDADLFAEPVTVVATGSLQVDGALVLPLGTVLVAGDSLTIGGSVTCRNGLFYGRNGVVVTGEARCGGQWLSRGYIGVRVQAYLTYPSVLFITGAGAQQGGRIELTGQAQVDGMIIHPQTEPHSETARRFRRGRVVIDPQARLRGGVYNGQETELHGQLYGTLLTNRTYFYYQSPLTPGTHKENWLRHATIHRPAVPSHFTVPLWFGDTPELTIMDWNGHAESLLPPDS